MESISDKPSPAPVLAYDRSTADQIFEYLRDEIIRMQLLPGEKIPETQLADKFLVSRTPVRAALAQLQAQGLVEVRPQRGTYVTKLRMPAILEARFIREAVEIAIACQLAGGVDRSVLKACEAIIKDQQAAAERAQALEFQKLDDLFHATLARATGFDRVDRLLESEKAHMDRVRNLSLVELTGQYNHVIRQHRAILRAIRSGSSEAATKAMQAHLRDVYNILKIAPEMHPEYFD